MAIIHCGIENSKNIKFKFWFLQGTILRFFPQRNHSLKHCGSVQHYSSTHSSLIPIADVTLFVNFVKFGIKEGVGVLQEVLQKSFLILWAKSWKIRLTQFYSLFVLQTEFQPSFSNTWLDWMGCQKYELNTKVTFIVSFVASMMATWWCFSTDFKRNRRKHLRKK